MNTDLAKRLASKRTKVAKDVAVWVDTPANPDRRGTGIKMVESVREGAVIDSVKVSTALNRVVPPTWGHPIPSVQIGDTAQATVLYVRHVVHKYLVWDFKTKAMKADLLPINWTSHAATTRLALQLHSIGWHDEARGVMADYWTHYDRTVANSSQKLAGPAVRETLAWFASYFTLGSRDLIAPWNFDEPDDPDSPFSHLLARWSEDDPNGPANLLLAYAEQNVARMLMRSNQRTTDYDDELMLFVPYDVMAIQMRRRELDLDPIPLDDPRVDPGFQAELDLMAEAEGEVPLIADDLVWPAYLKACAENGLTPYAPGALFEVELDRETLGLR